MAKAALELTPEESKFYTPDRHLGQTSDSDRYRTAWEIVPKLAARLRDEFGATQVVVFGSLLSAADYTRWSDIDLAARGISSQQFYGAIGCLNDMAVGFQVDLNQAGDDPIGLPCVAAAE